MSKFGKRKIAATLAFASLFSGKSQAMETKSSQNLATVGGATIASKNLPVKKGLSKGATIGIMAASILTLGTVAALIAWGVKSKGNKGPEDTGPDAEKQGGNKNIENQDIVDSGEDKGKEKDIIKTFDVNAVTLGQNQSNEKNLIKNSEKFLNKARQKLESVQSLLNESKILYANARPENKEVMLDFKEKVIQEFKELDSEIYVEKFDKMLKAVMLHQFSEDEKNELNDLLQVVKNNKIAKRSAQVMDVQNNVIGLQLQGDAFYYLTLEENDFVIEKSVNDKTVCKITLNY